MSDSTHPAPPATPPTVTILRSELEALDYELRSHLPMNYKMLNPIRRWLGQPVLESKEPPLTRAELELAGGDG